MKSSRVLLLAALLVIVAGVSWYLAHRAPPRGGEISVYYTKPDGKTEVEWRISMRAPAAGESGAEHLDNTALYAATQAVAGPPSDVSALRFPAGTNVRAVNVSGSTASVDLSRDVKNQTSDIAGETGAFKALVWTLTAIPGIDSVAVSVEGQKLATLPGGHLELDEPLRRSDF